MGGWFDVPVEEEPPLFSLETGKGLEVEEVEEGEEEEEEEERMVWRSRSMSLRCFLRKVTW